MNNCDDVDAPPPRRKAYSYLRFSTPEQAKGDSTRRQKTMAEVYAAQHGLDLDQDLTFHDVGVSAFRGQNADAGRLAYFMEAVRSGQVPQGSVLLVEQLDRISRLSPRKALRVLEDIVETGVSVVTMIDGKEYTAESLDGEPMDLMISILTFMRSNEESLRKSGRLREAWIGKRQQMEAGKPATARLPAWLTLSDDRQTFEVIEDRAELVRRIFTETLAGTGQHAIARTLNSEGHKPWGRGQFWHRSYIAKVLANPAVVGTFVPHEMEFDGPSKTRRPLQPLENYFPAIVTQETFSEAQALRTAVGAPQRGRHAHRPISHFLAGLATCSACGAKMTRVQKGSRSLPSYVCSRARSKAGCTYRSLRCDVVEAALLRALPELLEAFEGAGIDDELDRALRGADETVDRLKRKARQTADRLLEMHDISGARPRAVLDRLRATEAELVVAEEALRSLVDRKDALTGATMGARVEKVLEALQRPADERSAADINLALRRVFDRAVFMGRSVEPDDAESRRRVSGGWRWWAVALEWKHGGECLVPISTFNKFDTGAQPGWRWQDTGETDDVLDQAG